MNAKGTLIAAMAAGYFAAAVPLVAHAADGDKKEPAKGEKASCKGKGGCKGHDKDKKAEKKDEKPAEAK